MLAKVKSFALSGMDCEEIEVEVDLSNGLPGFNIVGLPDKAVEEARERVKSAIKNSGALFPQKRITVNLAPANIKKEGAAFDLPIAIGILAAAGQVVLPKGILLAGELSLSGKLRTIKGVLAAAIHAKNRGYEAIYVPLTNAKEGAVIENVKIFPAISLKELVLHFRQEKEINPQPKIKVSFEDLKENVEIDMENIKGQEQAKRALEIAAAGGHNLLMSGPPGSGKTLLAKTMVTILPPLNFQEALEVSKIHSISGIFPPGKALITKRPFRNPHHSASDIALVGGGTWPKPGEISLAHRGVLFLDELPEFPRTVIEMLRQPLEDGQVTISRANGTLTFPAKFILIAAQNPCPCGFLNDPIKHCFCSPSQILKYSKRLSGPLLDRIDLHLNVPRVKNDKLLEKGDGAEKSASIRLRVERARLIQNQRFTGTDKFTNSEMSVKDLGAYCQLDQEGQILIKNALDRLSLSARSYSKILKIGRTIADLDESPDIKAHHLAEALQYRPVQ